MNTTFETSKQLYERACRVMPGGVSSSLRKYEQPVPIYFSHGLGSRCYDEDGNNSIDYQIGQGALLFGHAPDGLAETLGAQARRGTHFAAQSRLEIDVAERICAMVPSVECVRFSNSATEALLGAFRLARAVTGCERLLKFEGHYHGWSDDGLVGFGTPPEKWGPESEPAGFHPSEGVPSDVRNRWIISQWGDFELLKNRLDQCGSGVAAIVMEPVMCNTGCLEPPEGWLEAVRNECSRRGMLLIFDETITGLRFGASCAQGYYNVTPDITVLGKALGGGVPVSALGGSRKVFEKIVSGKVIHAGTLNGNPLCMAACRWALDQVAQREEPLQESLNRQGRKLMAGLKQLAVEFDIPMRFQGPGLVFHTLILRSGSEDSPVRSYRDYVRKQDVARWLHLRLKLMESGVRAIERGLWFLSSAHDGADIDETLRRARNAFQKHAQTWSAN